VAVWTPTLPPYRYPDASAVCGELQYKPVNVLDALVNPTLIVQVTSPSTIARDEGPKFVAYQAVPTLREYLLVSQDEPRVTRYTRLGGGSWERRDVTDLGASLEFESIGCALGLGDIYDGVAFDARPPAAADNTARVT
jgi:Uma2 family endonuclease